MSRERISIEGERVLLRELDESDVTDDYVTWMNDPEVMRFTESRFQSHTLESVLGYVTAARADPDRLHMGIVDRSDGAKVGNIQLGPIDRHHMTADIGLLIGAKDRWGRGLASEAIALIAEHGFAPLGLQKITAGIYAPNTGSRRAFAKAGFTEECVRRAQFSLDDGTRVDGITVALLAPGLR